MTSPLLDHLISRIRSDGPLTVADYMRTCLLHPDHGYYQTRTVFGADGDFITAPEVSQMFGEILGLWVLDRWAHMGRPSPFTLAEFGPGRGTLMADMVRAIYADPAARDAAQIWLIEAGSRRKAEQADAVNGAHWGTSVADLPAQPTLVIANEFFDALPVHQFIRTGGVWAERMVGVDRDHRLAWHLGPAGATSALIPKSCQSDCVEISPLGRQIMSEISGHIAAYGGAGLFIDYGYASGAGDTLQAVARHGFVEFLSDPGRVDLTAHVDFAALSDAAAHKGLSTYGIADQGAFLMALGIGFRAQSLAKGQPTDKQAQILADLKRLTAPDEMGTLFKVLAVQAPTVPPPPGFEP